MLPPLISAMYAAGLGLVFVLLSLRTLRLRRKLRIGLGDAGHPQMQRAIRVHANFAEYVPLCLGLMCLAEVQAAPAWLLHGLGIALVLARLIHARGVSQVQEQMKFRVIGVALTLSILLIASSYLIFNHLR
ncbi:MAG: glutathione metabolism protein [Burkholderiales bacterium]|nr:MAG: glutathione metabolism protein [Burkholderiales bacterium]